MVLRRQHEQLMNLVQPISRLCGRDVDSDMAAGRYIRRTDGIAITA